MNRKHTPLHDKWHRRVEGQIRDAIHHHPEWFSFRNARERDTCINSLAKRIVGEIVADLEMATVPGDVLSGCVDPAGSD